MGKISREAQIHKNEYKKTNFRNFSFSFDKSMEADVINKLILVENRNEYLRNLIRNDDEIFSEYAYYKGKQTVFPLKEDQYRIYIKLSRKSAQDVINKLDAVSNKNWYIRDLVLNDLKNEK